jgi:hypothetical protein
VSVRTTLTLDDDVAAKLADAVRRLDRPYRTVVNDALRRGLEAPPPGLEPFVVDARPMGLRPGLDLDDIEGLLDLVEGPLRR